MRILFAGTPALALSTLQGLVNSDHEIVGVLTASDQKSGRGQKLTPSPIKEWALEAGIPVLSPATLKDEEVLDAVRAFKADIMVVFAYGKIFRQVFLEIFPLGAINVHPSLLPRHRGPSPLVATLLALDKEAGITVQKMALKMDTGNILVQVSKDLEGSQNLEDLMAWVSADSPALVLEALEKLSSGDNGREQVEEQVTYCHMLTKEMGYLNLDESPELFVARVKSLNPSIGTRILMQDGEELMIRSACVIKSEDSISGDRGSVLGLDPKLGIKIRVGEGLVGLLTLQRQGKKAGLARDFWNGIKNKENLGFKSFTNGERQDV